MNRQLDQGNAAKSLVESMQIQCQLYEEWLDVMNDYSTVFSSDERKVTPQISSSSASSQIYKGGSQALHYRIKSSRKEVVDIVSDVFQSSLSQWEELPSGN